jgi:hypothetical protein
MVLSATFFFCKIIFHTSAKNENIFAAYFTGFWGGKIAKFLEDNNF